MIHFAAVCVGTAFPPEYVERLYHGIRTHFSGEWDFTVIHDRGHPVVTKSPPPLQWGLKQGVDLDKCRAVSTQLPIPPSWWHKLNLFRPDIWPKGETVFYMDLDTIIVGSLDRLAERKGFNMLNWGFSFYPFNSSVMIFPAGHYSFLFEEFRPHRMNDYPGDQEYTHKNIVAHGVTVNGIRCDEASSYKKHHRANGPEDESIVVFHGSPRPHELAEGQWGFAEWRGRAVKS